VLIIEMLVVGLLFWFDFCFGLIFS